MPNDLFHLAAEIIETAKYFDVSLQEIEWDLTDGGKFSRDSEIVLEDNGEEITAVVGLRVSSGGSQNGWTIALLLHQERIDGIDFEQRYIDYEGNQKSGWHRHLWDAATKSCKVRKMEVADLDNVGDLRQFLMIGFNLLGIVLNKADYGNPELPLN